MKKLVVLTGAGISAESGIKTFRDSDGLWEGHDLRRVASPEGWKEDPEMVLEFYNQRRKNAAEVEPNDAHKLLAELEKHFKVQIITQNVDNLHERAGSSKVLHLHGQLFQSRSTIDPNLIYDMDGWELKLGDKCEKGSQLRPNIVWFGELVPAMENAVKMAQTADIFLVVGTSMIVYPAAGLIDYVGKHVPKYILDPSKPPVNHVDNLTFIEEKATIGMSKLIDEHLSKLF